jgi:hypothetical protein
MITRLIQYNPKSQEFHHHNQHPFAAAFVHKSISLCVNAYIQTHRQH